MIITLLSTDCVGMYSNMHSKWCSKVNITAKGGETRTFRYENSKQFWCTAYVAVPLFITVHIPSWENTATKYSPRCKCLDSFLFGYYKGSTKITITWVRLWPYFHNYHILWKIFQCYKILTGDNATSCESKMKYLPF